MVRYYAKGAGASFQDQSVTGPADIFNAEDDGLIQFAATPAGAGLENGSGPSTFALDNPGTTNAVGLENVAPGDVLELPGTSVSEVSFGKASLSVTTSAGTYAFLIVGYDPNSPVTGYTAAQDPATGLVAITFTGVDTFSDAVKAATGPLAGDYRGATRRTGPMACRSTAMMSRSLSNPSATMTSPHCRSAR